MAQPLTTIRPNAQTTMLTSFVFIIVAFFLQGGRPEGRPLKPPIKLVLGAGVTGRPLFSDLLDDLGQVVAFRVLQN